MALLRASSWLALLLVCVTVRGQMISPLAGQHVPELWTREVFVSVYLDRLLKVDATQYRHQSVLYFFVTWYDPSAAMKIYYSTLKMLNGTQDCRVPCSSFMSMIYCCDDIYVPSFYFRNAFGFPQDRIVGYQLFPTAQGAMTWSVFVNGEYYQPMDMSHFPFDSMDLMVELEFRSSHYQVPSLLRNGTFSHPGVSVQFSSGGPKLFSIGQGDDTSQWSVSGMTLAAYNQIDTGKFFSDYSTIYSNPRDPFPLNPRPGTFNCIGGGFNISASSNGQCNVLSGVYTNLFGVYITVDRFWRYHLLNSVLPVVLCAYLGLIIFCLDKKDVSTRLEIVVTLFLSLTAIQFVVGEKVPLSSYVVPTEQLVIATYLYLAILAIGSILVYHVATRPEHKLAAQRRKEGWQRYLQAKRNAQAAAAGAACDTMLPLDRSAAPSMISHLGSPSLHLGAATIVDRSGAPSSNNLSAPSMVERPGVAAMANHSGSATMVERSGAGVPQKSSNRLASPSVADRQASANGLDGSSSSAQTPLCVAVEINDKDSADGQAGSDAGMRTTPQSTVEAIKPRQKGWLLGRGVKGLWYMCGGNKGKPSAKTQRPNSRVTSLRQIATDQAYAEYVSHMIDMSLAFFLWLAYTTTAILIFTLQNGYIELFDY